MVSTGTPFDAELKVANSKNRNVSLRVRAITVDRDVVAVVANDVTAEVETRAALERERERFGSLIAR